MEDIKKVIKRLHDEGNPYSNICLAIESLLLDELRKADDRTAQRINTSADLINNAVRLLALSDI